MINSDSELKIFEAKLSLISTILIIMASVLMPSFITAFIGFVTLFLIHDSYSEFIGKKRVFLYGITFIPLLIVCYNPYSLSACIVSISVLLAGTHIYNSCINRKSITKK